LDQLAYVYILSIYELLSNMINDLEQAFYLHGLDLTTLV